jgi:hypothetical protein
MIKYNSKRNDGFGLLSDLGTREVTLAEALSLLLFCDLDFGGKVVEYTETRLVSQSGVMGTTDISTFSGPWDEMQVLTRIGRFLKERGFGKYRIYYLQGGGIQHALTQKDEKLTRSQTIKAMLFHAFHMTDYPETIYKMMIDDLIAALTIYEHPTAFAKDIYSLLGGDNAD